MCAVGEAIDFVDEAVLDDGGMRTFAAFVEGLGAGLHVFKLIPWRVLMVDRRGRGKLRDARRRLSVLGSESERGDSGGDAEGNHR